MLCVRRPSELNALRKAAKSAADSLQSLLTRLVAIHFVFSRDSAEPTRPEEMFADQWSALTQAGFTASLCSDAVLAGTKLLRNVPPGLMVVHRGWMVKGTEYAALAKIEGGICVRRVEEFIPESERRYFVVRGVG